MSEMMKWSKGKWIRRISLYSLIAFDLAGIGWSAYLGFTLPAADAGMAWSVFQFLVIVTLGVIISEVISVVVWGKTVSSKIKHLTQKYGWKGWLLQALIYGCFIALAIHWVWIW